MPRRLLSILLLCLPPALATGAGPSRGDDGDATPETREESNVKALEAAPSENAIEREAETQEDPLTQRQEQAGLIRRQIQQELDRWNWRLYLSARLRYRKSSDEWLFGDGGSRVGFDASYHLSPRVRLFGLLEEGFNIADELDALLNPGNQSGTGTTIFTRLAYLGVESQRLTLTGGKNWSTYYQIASFTDRLISFGGEGTQFANAGTDGGPTGTGRADNVLQLRFMVNAIPDNWWFKPFRLNLQLQQGTSIPELDGYRYGTNAGGSAILHLRNEFILGIAYNRAPISLNRELRLAGLRGDEEALLLGSRWFGDDWYLGATLARLRNHATTDEGHYIDAIGSELYGKYRLYPNLWLTGGWNALQPDDDPRGRRFRIRYLVPGLLYELDGPSRFVYLEYKREDSRRADGSPMEDVMTVGIRWDFDREK